MKKKLLTTAILATIAGMVGVAHAQSSVTLYGVMDADVDYVNHAGTGGHHMFKMNDGMDQGNRWGLRGTEDLGNGLQAIFTLEGGFAVTTGAMNQGGNIFGRQIFVGLHKNHVGQLTFGRQYTLNNDWLPSYTTGGNTPAGNLAWHASDVDQLANSRINNAVKIVSDNFYGVQFGALYGFSNTSGDFGGNNFQTVHAGGTRTYSAGLKYNYGTFGIGAAIMDIKNPYSSVYGTGSQSSFGSLAIGGITPGAAVADLRSFGIGANYAFGPATVWAFWSNTNIQSGTTAASTPTEVYNVFEVGGKYNFTPAISGAVGYEYSILHNGQEQSGSAHWHQVTLTGDYAFSKRTDAYILGAYQSASGKIGNQCAQAQIGDSSGYYGNSGECGLNQVAVAIGIRHKF